MLDDVLKILGLDESDMDEAAKEQLKACQTSAESGLKIRLGCVKSIPDELKYIVTEVTVQRYNRIGSEGLSSHNVEGESMGWSNDSFFEPYEEDIQKWLGNQEEPTSYEGRLKFL